MAGSPPLALDPRLRGDDRRIKPATA